MLATSNYNISDCYNQIITQNPLTFADAIGPSRGVVEYMEGMQLSLGFREVD